MSTVPPAPMPRDDEGREPAHVIRSDAEALEVAQRLALFLAEGATRRDSERLLPHEELQAIARSGLWAANVPAAHGGAQVSYATIARILAIISAADPSIGHIMTSTYTVTQLINAVGSEQQREYFFRCILEGAYFGNATSEIGGKRADAYTTRFTPDGSGGYRIDGRKYYATGALLSPIISVIGLDHEDRLTTAFVETPVAGLTLVDDWDGMGQRTTASGSAIFDNVVISAEHLFPLELSRAISPQRAIAQIVHAAIDAGIAQAAIDATIHYVRHSSRPWQNTGIDKASDDPHIISGIGDLVIRLHAGEALLERAGRLIDAAVAQPSDDAVALATIAVAEAKVMTTQVALDAANRLFQYGGSSSTRAGKGLDIFWRNARTHTVHDPVHWKQHAVGDFYLNQRQPARNGIL
ncbi:SfnB family sulfur acquisition oxidoreductase [Pseudomonas sp. LRF_L74]|uniref:SfnB family sulfur acquisition oxidoreductase n=1 Tax=Pseudomonas sp. LRF_L74 TaxID=3369422 RepID=UPI003F615EBD